MSLLKMANDASFTERKEPAGLSDYIIPSAQQGGSIGSAIGVVKSLPKSKYGQSASKNAFNILKGGLIGGVVGAGAGLVVSPAVRGVSLLNKGIGNAVTPSSVETSEVTKNTIGSSLVGGALGSVAGARVPALKNNGKNILKGGLIGSVAGGSAGFKFERDVQKGKKRRDDKRARRDEYKFLKNEIKKSNQ